MGCDIEQIRLEVVNKSGAPQCTNQIENQSEGSALTLHDDVTVVVGVIPVKGRVQKTKWKFLMAFAMKALVAGVSVAIKVIFNFLLRNHLQSLLDCQNAFRT